jgi:hypothetical protein
MKTERVSGTLTPEEKSGWLYQMERDGFSSLWTWIQFVVRRHIREQEKEEER